jgi:PAS domain S-box-containing protein
VLKPRAVTPVSRTLLWVAALTVAYAALATLGLRWATFAGAASPVFPAAGLALAGLLLGGVRLWPAVFVGRMAASFFADTALPLWVDFTIASGNTLAAVAGTQALRWAAFDLSLRRLRDVLAFVAATVGHSAIAATIGGGALAVALGLGPTQVWLAWLNWWAGNVAGALVVAPLMLTWVYSDAASRMRARGWHGLLSTASTGAVTGLIFGPTHTPLLRTFLVFPFLVWAALTGGVLGAATTLVPMGILAVLGTTLGYGPLAASAAAPLSELQFLMVPQFISVAAVTTLVLAVVADERRGTTALRASEERLALALEAGQLGFWDRHVPSGRVEYGGQWAAMLGYVPDAIAPHVSAWERLIHPDDVGQVQQALRAHFEGRTPFYECEYRLRHRDGSWRWILDRGRVVQRQAEGDPLRAIGTHTDITARRQAQAERDELLQSERRARMDAERASRIKDEFLSTVSHELRTPLNAIMGWSQLLRARPGSGDEDLERALAAIDRNSRMQVQLVEDLLDMSRIMSGKLRLKFQPVDLRDIVAAAVASVAPSAAAKQIRVDVASAEDLVPVPGDPGRLQQVIWNLLSNAIKFTPDGGSVQVDLARAGDDVIMTVSDTGEGIEPEFLPYVFERFRQADASTTRAHSGLGLGLAIVKNLVGLHGGTVRAASAGEGRGSSFTVELPLHVAPGAGRHDPADAGRGDTGLSDHSSHPAAVFNLYDLAGLTVLFVDDTPDTREIVSAYLEEARARVTTAGTAEEALRLLEAGPADVLVSDIGMPGTDGFQFIRQVRALAPERGGLVPAVALTAFARAEDRNKALVSGFQMYLTKPFQPAELIAAIAMLARRDAGPAA